MNPETQGFAVGVLVCIIGWFVIRVAALTIDHGRTERAAADFDLLHPPITDESWAEHVSDALTVAAEPQVDDTVLVPLVQIYPQRNGGDR